MHSNEFENSPNHSRIALSANRPATVLELLLAVSVHVFHLVPVLTEILGRWDSEFRNTNYRFFRHKPASDHRSITADHHVRVIDHRSTTSECFNARDLNWNKGISSPDITAIGEIHSGLQSHATGSRYSPVMYPFAANIVQTCG